MMLRTIMEKVKMIKLAKMIAVTALTTASTQVHSLDQDSCFVSVFEDANNCKNDDVMIFTTAFNGSKGLPIAVSGAFCNFKYPIVYNETGVTCVFTDVRKESWNDANYIHLLQ